MCACRVLINLVKRNKETGKGEGGWEGAGGVHCFVGLRLYAYSDLPDHGRVISGEH